MIWFVLLFTGNLVGRYKGFSRFSPGVTKTLELLLDSRNTKSAWPRIADGYGRPGSESTTALIGPTGDDAAGGRAGASQSSFISVRSWRSWRRSQRWMALVEVDAAKRSAVGLKSSQVIASGSGASRA